MSVSSPVTKMRPRVGFKLCDDFLRRLTMIAVIFEFTAAQGRFPDYKRLAEGLGEEVAKSEGFISIERFQSISDPARFVSLSFWRDEESVRRWRNLQKHREAQAKGRGGIFSAYRLRVCQVLRDYTKESRGDAPRDSVAVHG
jgi:heme-degrading monooxygenase HmoA